MHIIKPTIFALALLSSPLLYAADSLFGLQLNGDLNADLITKSNNISILNLKPDLVGYKVNPTQPSPDFQDYYVGMKDNKIKQITAIGYDDIGQINSDNLDAGEPDETLDKQLLKYQTIKEQLSTQFGELNENQAKYNYFPTSTWTGDNRYLKLGTSLEQSDISNIENTYQIRVDLGTK